MYGNPKERVTMTVEAALEIAAHMGEHATDVLRAARVRLSTERGVREFQAEGVLAAEIRRRGPGAVWPAAESTGPAD